MSIDELQVLTKTLNIVEELIISKNELLPVYTAIGGAITGALATFLPTFYLEKRKEKKLSNKLKSSLIIEISALLEIIERRQYKKHIEDAIKYLEEQPEGTQYSLSVDVPSHYSRIYQQNCTNIGLLDSKSSKNIVLFHQLIDAIIQDIKPNSLSSEYGTIELYKEINKIFEEVIAIGNILLENK